MEQIGYSSIEHTYESALNNCICGDCKIINIIRIHDQKYIRSLSNVTLPQNTQPKLWSSCDWCKIKHAAMHHINDCQGLLLIVRCDDCQIIIDRMFEYFQNPHPLFEHLSKTDYLKTDIRDKIFAVKCKELWNQLFSMFYAISKFLCKDECWTILNIYLDRIHKECRISLSDLIKN